jgi:hypothetical protein
MLVQRADLPTGESRDFRDTKFFTNGNTALPSPEDVCRAGVKIDDARVSASRPRPVVFRDLGLLVKFGSEITIAEAQCLWFFNRHMKDKVPTPELFGWRTHGHQVFIYMELIQGDTLKERWAGLSAGDRDAILQELRACVNAWRRLGQEKEPYFIGRLCPCTSARDDSVTLTSNQGISAGKVLAMLSSETLGTHILGPLRTYRRSTTTLPGYHAVVIPNGTHGAISKSWKASRMTEQ